MWDVIVVGAGPAGAASATIVAQRGYRVLLLDKKSFPRDKICGDSIGCKSLQILDNLGVLPEVEKLNFNHIDRVKMVSPSGAVFHSNVLPRDDRIPQARIIPRKVLDEILCKHAVKSGAQFEEFEVRELILERGKVCGVRGKGTTGYGERRARIVIAADGDNSAIARLLDGRRIATRHRAVAIRAYFDGVNELDHCVEFYFNQTTLPGYAWIFPLNDHTANVGLGIPLNILAHGGIPLKQAFQQFITHPSVSQRFRGARMLEKPRGWSITLASQRRQRVYDGAMLVGDAGAFVSPLTGGGIHNALETGRIAAHVAMEALANHDCSVKHLSKFEQRWPRKLGTRLKLEALAQKVLSRPTILDLLIRQMSCSNRFAHFVLGLF